MTVRDHANLLLVVVATILAFAATIVVILLSFQQLRSAEEMTRSMRIGNIARISDTPKQGDQNEKPVADLSSSTSPNE